MSTVWITQLKIAVWAEIPKSQPASRACRPSSRSKAQKAGTNAMGCSQIQDSGAEITAWTAPEKATARTTSRGIGRAGMAPGGF